jgi:hypothetical protein
VPSESVDLRTFEPSEKSVTREKVQPENIPPKASGKTDEQQFDSPLSRIMNIVSAPPTTKSNP